MISIVLADDHRIVIKGFEMILGLQPDMEVVGEAFRPKRRSTWSPSCAPTCS